MDQLVTICIPVYNGGQFLAESLLGVVSQSYSNLEVLIVDDQSTDNTEQVIKSFAADDQRVKYVRNDRNLGLVGNWNNCLKLAKGDWIKFHFQDDLMQKDCIEQMLNLAIESENDLVICQREYFSTDDSVDLTFYTESLKQLEDLGISPGSVQSEQIVSLLAQDLLGKNFLGEPIAGLFRKDLIKKFGEFEPKMKQIVDFEFWLRIVLNQSFYFDSQKRVAFRVHANSASKANELSDDVVGASMSDRILLGSLFLTGRNYARFRDICRSQNFNLAQAIRLKMNEIIGALGLMNTIKFLGIKFLLKNFRWTFKNIARITLKSING